jgi:hypothetical protein
MHSDVPRQVPAIRYELPELCAEQTKIKKEIATNCGPANLPDIGSLGMRTSRIRDDLAAKSVAGGPSASE